MPVSKNRLLRTQITKSDTGFRESLSALEESVFYFLPTNHKPKGEVTCELEFETHQVHVGWRQVYTAEAI
jgi:hypothetical protein